MFSVSSEKSLEINSRMLHFQKDSDQLFELFR